MRVALFARYSSKLQDELSLDAQVHEMEIYVGRQEGWEITQRYLLPETRSSCIEKSDGFRAMVAAAKRREFEILLVHKLDRFGRDRDTSVIHKAMLRRLGIQVKSVVENLGNSIMDRVFEGILEVMSEWYGANLGQETRKGHRQLTRQGLWTGGKVPFGLIAQSYQDGARKHKRLAVCPNTGSTMVTVFEQIGDGCATGQVLEWVAAKTGERWIHATLYSRIRNPIYYGLIRYGSTTMPQGRVRMQGAEVTEGHWDGLVSKEKWDRANVALSNRKGSKDAGTRSYLLSGLITCSKCNSPIVGGTYGKEPRYSCSGRYKKICAHRSIQAETLERAVSNQAAAHLRRLDVATVVRAYDESLEEERQAGSAQGKSLRRRFSEVGLAEEHEISLNLNLVEAHSRDRRRRPTDQEQFAKLLRYLCRITLDLETKNGQLHLRLPVSREKASRVLV